jgi:hypothetical protein
MARAGPAVAAVEPADGELAGDGTVDREARYIGECVLMFYY